jgi:hypothetical protein
MVRLFAVLLLVFPASGLAQPKAPVRIGNVESVGALAKKTAKARISTELPALRACVVDERGKPKVSGTVLFRGLIAPDGTMLASEVASSSLGDRVIERCLGATLERVSFPKAKDDRDTHVHVELVVGNPQQPSAEERRATAGPGDPEFDDRGDPTPEVPDAPPSAQVLVQIRALEGTLTEASAKRASSRAVRAFRACYEPRLVASPGLAGRIALRSKITPKGESSHLTVSLTTLPEPVKECVVRAAQLIPFDAPNAPLTAEWTIVLAPRPDH